MESRVNLQHFSQSVAGVGKLTELYSKDGDRLYLNPPERLAFYEFAEGIEDLAHKTLCMVLIYTGCRISEAVNLRRKDIDVSNETLIIRTLKQGGKVIRQRELMIPDFIIDLLIEQAPAHKYHRIWRVRRETGWRWVNKQMTLAGLDGAKATCKGLRHAFAIDNASESVPLATISKWLGHAKLENTKIYLNFVGSEERKLAQITWPHLRSKLPPVSVTPATTITEIKSFPFDGDAEKGDQIINSYIKKREAKGWTASQIEHLTGYDEYDGRKHIYTVATRIAFVKHTQAVRDW